jgi:hypothetical protein
MNIGIRTIILIILGIIGTYAMIFSSVYSIPNAVEVRYGVPLTWGTNIITSISGAIDLWTIDIIRLAVDVAFWFTVLIVASAILNYKRKKPKETPHTPANL